MGGGLMQLVAYGAQDIYLTGNPQITFFKVVYRRHTNFSMEAIEQTFNGSVGFGNRVSATISRNGDLVSRLYVQWNPAHIRTKTATAAGNTLLSETEIEIGGQKIDKQSNLWMTTWDWLSTPNPTGAITAANTSVTGFFTGATLEQISSFNHYYGTATTATDTAYVPLKFWFCRNPGLALPLIALQYHEVKVNITFASEKHVASATNGSLDVKLWADYIYLDTDERRRFAQVSHEYLIEQVQEQTCSTGNKNFEVNFNHPVKELIWVGKGTAIVASPTAQGPGAPYVTADDFGPGSATSECTWQLKLNGHDRFAARDSRYFTRTQVLAHHTGFGGLDAAGCRDSIAVYSFALKPEEHQPSGTCNFSRIDNAQLITNVETKTDMQLYAVNYNVLRIMSGMGGLAYSN